MNTKQLAGRIFKSAIFKKIAGRAEKLSRNMPKLISLTSIAVARLSEADGQSSLKGFKENMLLLVRMVRAQVTGRYKHIPMKSLVKIALGILYFAFFADFIPDFIPVFGLLDDAIVLGWVVDTIKDDIAAFKAWESGVQIADGGAVAV